nr:uncharacterized protein LOC111417959 isoform X1 [Onthophagus taurus]
MSYNEPLSNYSAVQYLKNHCDSDSDNSYSGESELNEEYERLLPPPIPKQQIKRNSIRIREYREVKLPSKKTKKKVNNQKIKLQKPTTKSSSINEITPRYQQTKSHYVPTYSYLHYDQDLYYTWLLQDQEIRYTPINVGQNKKKIKSYMDKKNVVNCIGVDLLSGYCLNHFHVPKKHKSVIMKRSFYINLCCLLINNVLGDYFYSKTI